jgi:hypothetical protein
VSTVTLAPSVRLDVPPDFHEIPLDAAVEDRVAARTAVLDDLGLHHPEQREGLGLYFEAMARALRGGPVVGTAFCAVEIDGRPSTATLSVGVQTGSPADPLVTALGIAEVVRNRGQHDSVSVERIGPHHAVVATGPLAAEGQQLRTVTIATPLPAGRIVVLITLATPCHDDFPIYARVARQVAASARLVRPDSRGDLLA